MNRHLVTAGFLVVALICYGIGAVGPGFLFLALGGIAELIFWLRVFGGKR